MSKRVYITANGLEKKECSSDAEAKTEAAALKACELKVSPKG